MFHNADAGLIDLEMELGKNLMQFAFNKLLILFSSLFFFFFGCKQAVW